MTSVAGSRDGRQAQPPDVQQPELPDGRQARPLDLRPVRRWLGRLLPWAVLGLWTAALVGIMPFAIGLESVQSDEPIDYLPASADSTRVAELAAQLPGGDADEYIVVYHRATGITATDRTAVRQQYAELRQRFGGESSPDPDQTAAEVLDSADGTALMYVVPVSPRYGDPEEVVVEIRDAVTDRPGGLNAEVTGPAALGADLDEVFDGIDEALVLATIAVVTSQPAHRQDPRQPDPGQTAGAGPGPVGHPRV